MSHFFRTLALALCLVLVPSFAAANSAMDSEKKDPKDGNLPPALEEALTGLLDASKPGAKVNEADAEEVLRYIAAPPEKKPEPAVRPEGSGVVYRDTIRVPLKTLMSYILDPGVPGEALYPNSVRRNAWVKGSELQQRAAEFLASPLPPEKPLIMHAREEEETTPDVSSGCHYEYTLNRLFILTSVEGRPALFSISRLPGKSEVGKKGIIVGDDSKWHYVYTQEPGTNLSMLGWAETYLYGSASVTVYLAGKDGNTDMFSFKWTKAGWAGSNVVRASHITDGVRRFASGLKQVLESPKRPAPEAIKARMAELEAMDDAALRAELQTYAKELRAGNDKALKGEYGEALEKPDYAAPFTRKQLIADLIKNYMRATIQP